MTFPYSPSRMLCASAFVVAFSGFTVPALALDADDFATKLAAISSQSGTSLSFSAVEPDGSTIVLKSVRVQAPGQAPFNAGDITFYGVEEVNDGSYHADQALFEDIQIVDGPTKVSITGIQMSNLKIPPVKQVYDPADNIGFFQSISTGQINFEHEGDKVFSLGGTKVNLDSGDDGNRVDIKMSGSDLWIDLDRLDDAKARQGLAELGYQTLTGDISVDGMWQMDTGILNVTEMFSLDDVGSLSLSMQVSGYTRELVEAMQQAQKAAAENPDKKAAEQALGLSMLGLMQQLSFNSAAIRFEDASVTERALAFAGKQQGVSGDQMRMALKGMLPLMLGQIGIPELQKQIAAAANVYLDNPQNITITAKPESPVALPVIMGAGMGDPKSLVDLLNVEVSANTSD
ncbi:hypothetical protein SAMN05877838_2271 [Hoeflea halophila]|uniref:DUF945 domain-containing protein n=1 Tax=Hoeflea halophila TaxID=714899 RepID=A0A286IBC3_9HYPH|nr:hypothetical protein [Hoeflea halophila]SOE17372.1 hypothetical protein SAMN05877838_2271 [Hoeflea halophila]